jgi:hypothetical protein
MPSFKSVFLLATAALAGFTSASPLATPRDIATSNPLNGAVGVAGVLPGRALEQRKDFTDATRPIVVITESGKQMMTGMLVAAAETAEGLLITVADVIGLGSGHEHEHEHHKRTDKPTSLPLILLKLEADLKVILQKIISVIGGKDHCDVDLLKPLLEEVHALLAIVLEDVKGLIGLAIEVILCLDGKVLAVVDVAKILAAVLALLCKILVLICGVLDAVGLKAIAALLASISTVVAAILHVVFELVVDLLHCLSPLIGDVVKILINLKLDAILDVLKVAH